MGFSIDDPNHAFLGGFYLAEPWGAWSKVSAPWVMIPYALEGKVRMHLHLVGFGHNANTTTKIHLGDEVSALHLPGEFDWVSVDFELPKGVKADVDGNTKIVLESIDKELLGLTAAKIREVRKPEPYKGKGIRYEDEHIVRKVGKAGAAK